MDKANEQERQAELNVELDQTISSLHRDEHIKYEELEMDKLLAAGSFGEVWKAKWKKNATVVAVKRIKPEALNPAEEESFRQELEILHECNHPNILFRRLVLVGSDMKFGKFCKQTKN